MSVRYRQLNVADRGVAQSDMELGPPFTGIAAPSEVDGEQLESLQQLQQLGCVPLLTRRDLAAVATKLRLGRCWAR